MGYSKLRPLLCDWCPPPSGHLPHSAPFVPTSSSCVLGRCAYRASLTLLSPTQDTLMLCGSCPGRFLICLLTTEHIVFV
ncbi:hypothetical protein BGX38DRAFT_1223975 [Terfezia claveryi]|nr:hypothetical protein BGX38DRAFT_1223975 [Terfezia claveryi]